MTDPNNKGSSNTFNVTSNNQSGGQTAGVINNYAPRPRQLDQSRQTTLATAVTRFRGTSINVFHYDAGGQEAVAFARQIVQALQGAGWSVSWIHGTESGEPRSSRPVPGTLVEVRATNQLATSAAAALTAAIRAAGIAVDGPLQFDAWSRGGIMAQGSENPNAELQLTIGANNP